MADAKEPLMLLRTAESLTVDDALELAGGWSLYQRRLMFYLGAVQACSASHRGEQWNPRT